MDQQQRSIHLQLPKNDKLDIHFDSLSYQVSLGRVKKQILNDLSGMFKSGELTAIMGPSGAGKSSLLNILSGFQKRGISGKISCTGQIEKSGKKVMYKKDSCYILQDDRLCPLFTVKEVMNIAAKLKLGLSISEKAKELLIMDILDTFGLSTVLDTKCGRLSGGQRKRVSVALELIDNPPIMFLDEPTTGLDSLSSFQCINILKRLAKHGRTIVCTIHQPSASIFEMFDHVYVLAEGHCVYQGASTNAVPFLSSVGLNCPQYHNPADHLIEVASGEYGDFVEHLTKITKETNWRLLDGPKDKTEEQISYNEKTMVLIHKPSELYRFFVLFNRCLIQLYRDWTVTHLKLLIHAVVGIFVGILYLNYGNDGSKSIKNMGYFIVSLVYLSYTSMMPAIVKLPSEVPVLKKENFNNWYNLQTYYLAFLISNLPIQMISALVYTILSYLISGQPIEANRFLMFLSIAILTNLVSEAFGVVIGTTVNPVLLVLFRVGAAIFVAAVLSLLYPSYGLLASRTFQNLGFIIVSVVYSGFTSVMPAVLSISQEIKIIAKENLNNWYNLFTIHIAWMLAQLPFQIVYAILFSAIAFYFTQPLELYRYFVFALTILLNALACESLGIFVSTFMRPVNGVFTTSVILAVYLLHSGFFVLIKDSTYVHIVSFISIFAYAFDSVMHAIYGFNRGKLYCPEEEEFCEYSYSERIMEMYYATNTTCIQDAAFLIGFYVILRFITLITLSRKLRQTV